MDNSEKILAVIPARGGSKGIPKKNLKLLNGKPLIAYTIEKLLEIKAVDTVCVSSDDDQIIDFCQNYPKVHVVRRPDELAQDATTLDPTIYHAFQQCESDLNTNYEYIFTFQPTSPLLSTEIISSAIQELVTSESDSLISVNDDRHLAWTLDSHNKALPKYKERVNRQYLPPEFRETGAILGTHRSIITPANRLGSKVHLFETPAPQSVDIDTYLDWTVAESLLQKPEIGFIVAGNESIGLGHVYRALTLAHRFNFKTRFFIHESDTLALKKVLGSFYECIPYTDQEDLLQKLTEHSIDLIINDTLDTSQEYATKLKEDNRFVVTFEDFGPGADYVDMTINALYESSHNHPNHYYGYQYVCLRDEFLMVAPKESVSEDVNTIMVTFGGTDPNNITEFTMDWLVDNLSCDIILVLGLGYQHKDRALEKYSHLENVEIHTHTKKMSALMKRADLIISSNGRTVYEVAYLAIPSIVFCQNTREIKHTFGEVTKSVINVGLFNETSKELFKESLDIMISDVSVRQNLFKNMSRLGLNKGTDRVIDLILTSYREFNRS